MTEVTTGKTINEAIVLYDKGNWTAAADLLKPLLKKKINLQGRRAVLMHLGWCFWKSGEKAMAEEVWRLALSGGADDITRAGAHAGLGIYYAELGDRKRSLHHAQMSQKLTPKSATMNHIMNLNACAISLAKLHESERAEQLLRKIMELNEVLERSSDTKLARKAGHQRAKNGYNLASLVQIPQGRLDEARKELYDEVIPRYSSVGAVSDLAAAYHRMAEIYEKMSEIPDAESAFEKLELALVYEKVSLSYWKKSPDDPSRIKTAELNIKNLCEKITAFSLKN